MILEISLVTKHLFSAQHSTYQHTMSNKAPESISIDSNHFGLQTTHFCAVCLSGGYWMSLCALQHQGCPSHIKIRKCISTSTPHSLVPIQQCLCTANRGKCQRLYTACNISIPYWVYQQPTRKSFNNIGHLKVMSNCFLQMRSNVLQHNIPTCIWFPSLCQQFLPAALSHADHTVTLPLQHSSHILQYFAQFEGNLRDQANVNNPCDETASTIIMTVSSMKQKQQHTFLDVWTEIVGSCSNIQREDNYQKGK